MTITITAFERSPDRGKGLARDMRVRWALEEAGQPYDVRLVSFEAMKQPAHKALHPFGQIPTYEEGDLALFESGAIVLHMAERHAGLLPPDANARARAIQWMFAALNTGSRRSSTAASLRSSSATSLGTENACVHSRTASATDLLMVTVLRRLIGSGTLEEYPNLSTYVARGEARPAYQRAFATQLAVFTAASNA